MHVKLYSLIRLSHQNDEVGIASSSKFKYEQLTHVLVNLLAQNSRFWCALYTKIELWKVNLVDVLFSLLIYLLPQPSIRNVYFFKIYYTYRTKKKSSKFEYDFKVSSISDVVHKIQVRSQEFRVSGTSSSFLLL